MLLLAGKTIGMSKPNSNMIFLAHCGTLSFIKALKSQLFARISSYFHQKCRRCGSCYINEEIIFWRWKKFCVFLDYFNYYLPIIYKNDFLELIIAVWMDPTRYGKKFVFASIKILFLDNWDPYHLCFVVKKINKTLILRSWHVCLTKIFFF